ncbi:F0F1 ATP synthase subunit B [Kurthia senegalensis]|uniref:F0F1 ATP synthase subunit B n=1 Tax=Kurthia senegalensis TaxID=1033740 RepID=UPI000287A6CD|nr:F0F1 ATP synthase subunit B [Kurthia senegalensis]
MFLDHLVLGAAEHPGVNWGDIIYMLVVFIVLMAILKKVAWGPLMGIMQKREEQVANDLDEAAKNRQESQQLLEQQRSLLSKAQGEAQGIVENAKKQAEMQKEEIVSAAKNEAARLQESAKRDIEAEKEKAIAAVRGEVVSLSVLAASKVLAKEVSEEDNRSLIEETIAKAGEAR